MGLCDFMIGSLVLCEFTRREKTVAFIVDTSAHVFMHVVVLPDTKNFRRDAHTSRCSERSHLHHASDAARMVIARCILSLVTLPDHCFPCHLRR